MRVSPLVAELAPDGAVPGERPEAPGRPAILGFGDPEAEARAALDGALLLDATDRGALRVEGDDAATFLHRLLTGDVRGLAPGEAARNLLLSPKGRVLHDLEVLHDGTGFLVWTPPGPAEPGRLAADLERYHFQEDVSLEDRTEASAPLELVGPRAEELAGVLLERDPPERPLCVRTAVAGSVAVRIDGGPGSAARLWRAAREAGARPGGVHAREILRIEAGAALFGLEIEGDVYPQEVRLDGACHPAKGCYIGQEVVAKIDTYAGLNRRLAGLALDDGRPVAAGTEVRDVEGNAKPLGHVTSWVRSPTLGRGLALALLRVGRQAPGTRVRMDGGREAEVVRLPVRPGALPLAGEHE